MSYIYSWFLYGENVVVKKRPAPRKSFKIEVCLSDRNWIFCKKAPFPHHLGGNVGNGKLRVASPVILFLQNHEFDTKKTQEHGTWCMVNSPYKTAIWGGWFLDDPNFIAGSSRHFWGSRVFHFGNTISPLHDPNLIRTALWWLSIGRLVPSVSVALNRSWWIIYYFNLYPDLLV